MGAFASSYGAAASFIVILFWVFYSAQILYFGAEFTRAYTPPVWIAFQNRLTKPKLQIALGLVISTEWANLRL
jgi:uncharacterized BrkB/YihY/UPF0761 family membrane protein